MDSAKKDNLKLTLDYAQITDIIKTEMSKPSKLIESVNKRIVDNIILLVKKSYKNRKATS